MRFFLLLAVLTFGLMAGPAPAMANNLPAGSVGEVLENCEQVAELSPTNTNILMGICLGFVNAVLQGWRRDNADVCLPANFTEGQAIATFVSWGRARPQSLQEASLGILDALREKFPCKR
jgi:hypothetical protein